LTFQENNLLTRLFESFKVMAQEKSDVNMDERFDLPMGEQTRVELTEAEAEFLKVLDDEMEQKGLNRKPTLGKGTKSTD
jgi:hypothetical protein